MGYLGATLTQVFTRAGGTDVALRDVTIAQMGNGATEYGWRHAPETCRGLRELGKIQLVELSSASGEYSWPSLVTGAHMWGGGADKTSQNRKNVYLSPYVEEPLNSKVIKSFVPELRSRVFRVSRFLCSMYICYEHFMYVSRSHIMAM